MKRTTLSLSDDLAVTLEREARRRDTSLSRVARDALEAHFGLDEGAAPSPIPFAGIARSGHGDTARRSEEVVGEIFEDRARDRRKRAGRS